MIDRLSIIGVGLMGGSLALALRRAGYVGEIVGADRDPAALECAQTLGAIDRFETDPARAVAGAQQVVLAVPLGAVRGVCEQLRPALHDQTVVTDVGSAKGSVVADLKAVFDEVPARWVPAHPIAGNEQSGVEAAFAGLFEGHRVILTPLSHTRSDAVEGVRRMWEAAGARVEMMGVTHHDLVLAATSHLPHMLAFGLVDSLARLHEQDEVFRYAAGGFRDFTRIASSDPVMWRDICLANREAILAMLKHYSDDLAAITQAIEQHDAQGLLTIFTRAKQARDDHC